jgi:hypothetical protein
VGRRRARPNGGGEVERWARGREATRAGGARCPRSAPSGAPPSPSCATRRLDALHDARGPLSPASGEPAATGDADAEAARLLDGARRDLHDADGALNDLAREALIALTVIKGRAQLMRRQSLAAGAADVRLFRSIDEIDRAVTALDRLVRDGIIGPLAVADRRPADS